MRAPNYLWPLNLLLTKLAITPATQEHGLGKGWQSSKGADTAELTTWITLEELKQKVEPLLVDAEDNSSDIVEALINPIPRLNEKNA